MAWSRVLRFDDSFAYSPSVQAATALNVLPTERGAFEGVVTQIRFDRLWMQRFEVNLSHVSAGSLAGNRKVFAFSYGRQSGEIRSSGIDLALGGIVALNPSYYLRSASNIRLATLSLPIDAVSVICETLIGHAFQDTFDLVRTSSELMSRLSRLHGAIGLLAHDTPDILTSTEVGKALEQQVTHLLIRGLTEGTSERGPKRHRSQHAIVRRFLDYLAAHTFQPLYMPELCMALGVPERTLRASCEEYLGMGPIRYLALRRMHLARHALLRAGHESTTVTQIVTEHGFWELGRFSVAYRALFGETPSETLRRPSII